MQTSWWQRLTMVILLSSVLLCGSMGLAQALQVGDKAPDFTLPSTTGDDIKLSDYLGKKAVVLFFYIGAFTKS